MQVISEKINLIGPSPAEQSARTWGSQLLGYPVFSVNTFPYAHFKFPAVKLFDKVTTQQEFHHC
jgi:hypothetical protein